VTLALVIESGRRPRDGPEAQVGVVAQRRLDTRDERLLVPGDRELGQRGVGLRAIGLALVRDDIGPRVGERVALERIVACADRDPRDGEPRSVGAEEQFEGLAQQGRGGKFVASPLVERSAKAFPRLSRFGVEHRHVDGLARRLRPHLARRPDTGARSNQRRGDRRAAAGPGVARHPRHALHTAGLAPSRTGHRPARACLTT
jgi:hypothetical protein